MYVMYSRNNKRATRLVFEHKQFFQVSLFHDIFCDIQLRQKVKALLTADHFSFLRSFNDYSYCFGDEHYKLVIEIKSYQKIQGIFSCTSATYYGQSLFVKKPQSRIC